MMNEIGARITSIRAGMWNARDRMKRWVLGQRYTQAKFTQIYEQNLWGNLESVSGAGSSLAATKAVRSELPALLARLGVRHVLDAPCGDFTWMKEITPRLVRYMGVDVVPGLIARNQSTHASETVQFICADICIDNLQSAELVLCRDCFIHLPTALIYAALRNFKNTGAHFLLLTNCADAGPYSDIAVGSFRPIDFRRSPFSFPEPLFVIREIEGTARQLCLWDLSALPI
jgi:SAM-dependent methyltransferase